MCSCCKHQDLSLIFRGHVKMLGIVIWKKGSEVKRAYSFSEDSSFDLTIYTGQLTTAYNPASCGCYLSSLCKNLHIHTTYTIKKKISTFLFCTILVPSYKARSGESERRIPKPSQTNLISEFWSSQRL